MKETKVIEGKKSVNIEEIKKFADRVRIKLPNDYVCFLLKHNGGYTIEDTVDLIEPSDEIENSICIDRFLALYDGEHSNLSDYYETYRNRTPEELLPIANDPGGNLLCLCIAGENYGKVYFWDHDWESEEGEEPTYDNVSLVANSFTDFINGLYEFELEEDENGDDIDVSIHDKYSLPTSRYIREHGKVITDFFDKAPKDVDKFVIKEFTANGDLLLSFKSGRKEYLRKLNKEGKIIEES